MITKNYWASQLDEWERRRFESMANELVVAQEIRSQAKKSKANYGPLDSSGDAQVAPVTARKKIMQSEQRGLFEVAFAEIWRNAQRQRATYFGSWLSQVFRRVRRTVSVEASMQEAESLIARRRAEHPYFALSTGVAELGTGSGVTNKRDRAA